MSKCNCPRGCTVLLGAAFVLCVGSLNGWAQEVPDINHLRAQAQTGDSNAQWQLGMQYRQGNAAIPKNLGEAFTWFMRSAKSGNPKGENAVGIAYLHGEGIPEDHATGFEWLYKSALKGYPSAQFNLGAAYLRGTGTSRNEAEAFNWFLQAARNGESTAQLILCAMYQRSTVTGVDPTVAYAWCLVAHPKDAHRVEEVKTLTATALAATTPEEAQEAKDLASSWSANHLNGATMPVHSRAFLATQPLSNVNPLPQRHSTESAQPAKTKGCESGHWVDSVLSDGEIVKLEDGSIWRVEGADTVDSSLWLSTDDVIVCDGKLIDTDDHTTVNATRMH